MNIWNHVFPRKSMEELLKERKEMLGSLKDDVNALVVAIHYNYNKGNMSEQAYEQLNNNSEDLIDKTEVLLSTIN